MIDFRITKRSKKSRARLGILKTPHGIIETPSLIPVATQAAVKTLRAEDLGATKTQAVIMNTFHLHLKPGERIVKKLGGLHRFSGIAKPIMTDSGGFQVFSLGFGRDHGVGKILKKKKKIAVRAGTQPKSIRITEDGVWFSSPVDGKKLFLGPRESIRIQEALGGDIMFAFDECTSPVADKKYTELSLQRTHRWAKICLDEKTSRQALYGIVQGGKYKDLRKKSAEYIGALPFDGFGIGGEFGDEKQTMTEMLRAVTPLLPEEKPRHLLGIGHPEDIRRIIKEGVDTFDCIVPTHYARHGTAFTSRGRMDMAKPSWLADAKPLDPRCGCGVCAKYSRGFIAHLVRAHEITGLRLLTEHNLYFFNTLVEEARNDIKKGKL